MIVFLDIVLGIAALIAWSIMLYNPYFKRFWDIVLSALAIIVLSPLMLVLTILGAIKMKGNPFFTQERPGKDEKIFKLIKFRSMTCEKDINGNLLPDSVRLTNYGRRLRLTSLDELPELLNVLKGNMSLVGPRPLLIEYLPYYTDKERHRHDIRPGMTGNAQVKGRNFISWEETFLLDLEYVENLSLFFDLRILAITFKKVIQHENITDATQGTEDSSGLKVHDSLDIERRTKQ